MSQSTKAALLSALVFPGAGHFYLKQKKRGLVLIAATFSCLWIIVANAIDQAVNIINQMQTQGIVDLNRITEMSTQAMQNTDSLSNTLALLILLGCWLFAVIDSYRLGSLEKTSTEKNIS